jgi:hypothetical protein
MLLLVDHSYSAQSDSWAGGAATSDTMAWVADLGAVMGVPDRCCIIRGGVSALHAAAADHALQPSSAAKILPPFSSVSPLPPPLLVHQCAATKRRHVPRVDAAGVESVALE